jgi:hypothetical protein
MTLSAIPGDRQLALPPVDDKVDHVRGSPVLGIPTLFIDGVVHRGGYDPPTLLAAPAP